MNLFVLSQIVGSFGAIAMIISMWQKERKKILFYLIFDNIFYAIHYLILNAYTGALSNIVGLIRIYLFGKKDRLKQRTNNIILIVICLIYMEIGLISYDGPTSLFPIVASITYCLVIWQNKPKNIRLGTAVMLILWFLYNCYIGSYVGMLTEGLLFISSVIAIIKIDILKIKGEKKNDRRKH